MQTTYGQELVDPVEIRDRDGELLFVEATMCDGDRRVFSPHQLRLDHPARRKTDMQAEEGEK